MKVRAVPRREWTIVVGGGAVVAAALALSILLACGCASSAQPARDVPDVPDVADGGPGSDAGSNAFLDASPPEGGMLAAGDSLSVRQVTSDGYVVYSDDAVGKLYAVPLAGGMLRTSRRSAAISGSRARVARVRVVRGRRDERGDAVRMVVGNGSPFRVVGLAGPRRGGIEPTEAGSSTSINVDAGGRVRATSTWRRAMAVAPSSSSPDSSSRVCLPQLGFAGVYAMISHCDVARGAGPSATSAPSDRRRGRGRPGHRSGEPLVGRHRGDPSPRVDRRRCLVAPIGGGPAAIDRRVGFLGQLIEHRGRRRLQHDVPRLAPVADSSLRRR